MEINSKIVYVEYNTFNIKLKIESTKNGKSKIIK